MPPKQRQNRGRCARHTDQEIAGFMDAFRQRGSAAFHEFPRIPRTTKRRWVNAAGNVKSPGRPRHLNDAWEHTLVEWITISGEQGWLPSTDDVLSFARGMYARQNDMDPDDPGVKELFQNGWIDRFKERNPIVKQHSPSHFESARAMLATEDRVRENQEQLQEHFDRFPNLQKNPNLIINFDETNFSPDGAVTRRGFATKPVRVVTSSYRQSLTAICAATAEGRTLPPYLIFKGANSDRDTAQLLKYAQNPDSKGHFQKSGWMDSNGMVRYWAFLWDQIQKHIRPGDPSHLDEESAEWISIPWISLHFDSHVSHLNLEVLRDMYQKKIIAMNLRGHLTALLQPLDTGIFVKVKRSYRQALGIMSRPIYRPSKRKIHSISQEHVIHCATEAIHIGFTRSTIAAAFERAGVYPFNPNLAQELKDKGEFLINEVVTGRAKAPMAVEVVRADVRLQVQAELESCDSYPLFQESPQLRTALGEVVEIALRTCITYDVAEKIYAKEFVYSSLAPGTLLAPETPKKRKASEPASADEDSSSDDEGTEATSDTDEANFDGSDAVVSKNFRYGRVGTFANHPALSARMKEIMELRQHIDEEKAKKTAEDKTKRKAAKDAKDRKKTREEAVLTAFLRRGLLQAGTSLVPIKVLRKFADEHRFPCSTLATHQQRG
eukprot:m.11193 g.11193  ORF g.11193 m.11193 type:complete len:664 (+) comp15092_c0_seq2:2-1993(+)